MHLGSVHSNLGKRRGPNDDMSMTSSVAPVGEIEDSASPTKRQRQDQVAPRDTSSFVLNVPVYPHSK